MFKRALLTLGIIAGTLFPAYGAGLIPLSLQQVFDTLGRPLSGCRLYTYQAGTTTPQTVYQDSGLSLAWPNPVTCDSAGRLPQMFAADGNIKLRLSNSAGVTQLAVDSVLVIGPSSGSGGGGSVDATTVLATGDLKARYGTGTLAGFVRANGRTIGSATSGATERANADTEALFLYLWDTDANLSVSGGRGASAAADWAANKNIALPDWRGRVIAGMDDMGNSAAGVLTTTYLGVSATTLGNGGGSQSSTLAQTNLPNVTLSVTGTAVSTTSNFVSATGFATAVQSGGGPYTAIDGGADRSAVNSTITGSASLGGSATAFSRIIPLRVATIYLKL